MMSASLSKLHDCLFRLAPSGESLLLRSIVRTRFQFLVLTGVAVEVQDFLLGFRDFRHMLSPIHVERDKPFKVGIVVLPVIEGYLRPATPV